MDRGKVLRRSVASAGLVAVAALAACTGPGPIVTETPSASSTPAATASASASPTPTTLTDAELLALLPPEAASPDEDGAVAAAQYFLALYPGVRRGEGWDVWQALSLDECMFCASSIENAGELLRDGTEYLGGEVSFNDAKTNAYFVEENDANEYVMELRMLVAPTSTTYSDGTVEETPKRRYVVHIQVRSVDGIWRTVGVAVDLL